METIQNNSPKVFEQDKGKDKQLRAHKKRKRIRKYELVSKWKNPVGVLTLEGGTI